MKRRHFIESSSAALALASHVSAAPVPDFSTMKKRVGVIGTGWYGKSDLFRLIQVAPVEIVCLCDVDEAMLKGAADLVMERQVSKQRPALYADYRKMLAEHKLDIVLIGTPDHWHALCMIAAVKAGADVYVQKPTGVDVIESQAMLAAARKYQRVVQVGTQRRSTPHLIEARETIVKAGKLGTVGLVEICCYYHMRSKENPPDGPVPAGFDYDFWTGPAPLRPYNKMVHPRSWRAFMEYGNGIVGDMCVHMLDMTRWLLDLGWPTSISSTGGILIDKASKANITDTQTATFDFGGLKVVWTHRSYGEAPDAKYPWAATFYGDKGTLKASVNSFDYTPQGKGEAIHRDCVMELEQYPEDKTEKDLEKHVAPAIRGHLKNFLACIADRSKPVADIEQGHISSATCILANVALQLGRTLHWDAAKHEVTGDPEANQLLRRPYRAPWVHPEAGAV